MCNALETLLVHKAVAEQFLPKVAELFDDKQVVVHACHNSIGYFSNGIAATDADWDAEYLAPEIAVRVVDDFEQTIAHLQRYSSQHTEVIVDWKILPLQMSLRRVTTLCGEHGQRVFTLL